MLWWLKLSEPAPDMGYPWISHHQSPSFVDHWPRETQWVFHSKIKRNWAAMLSQSMSWICRIARFTESLGTAMGTRLPVFHPVFLHQWSSMILKFVDLPSVSLDYLTITISCRNLCVPHHGFKPPFFSGRLSEEYGHANNEGPRKRKWEAQEAHPRPTEDPWKDPMEDWGYWGWAMIRIKYG